MSHVTSQTFIASFISGDDDPSKGFLSDYPFLKDDPRYKKYYAEENGTPVIFAVYMKDDIIHSSKVISFFDENSMHLYNFTQENKNYVIELGYEEIPEPIAHRAIFNGPYCFNSASNWEDGPGPWPREVNESYNRVTYEYAYPAGHGRDDIITYKVSPSVPWKNVEAPAAIPYSPNAVYGYALKRKKYQAPASDEPSSTTKALQELLASRDAMGRKKYGTSLDRTDLTATDWLNHMLEELLDGAGYAMRAIEGIKRIETKLKNLEVLLKESKS